MKDKILQVLLSNGFSDKESQVYLEVLEMGEGTVTRVAQRTHIKRTTVYNVMQEMESKGFLSITTRKGTQYVSALAPELLLDRLGRSYDLMKGITGDLIQLAQTSAVKPQMQFFDGLEGIKHCYVQVDKAHGDVVGFTNYDEMPEEMFRFIRSTFIPLRKKRQVPARFIAPKTSKSERIASEDEKHYLKHKLVESLEGTFDLELFLLNESDCYFLSFAPGETFAIMIRSKTIYRMLRSVFQLVWGRD